MKLYSYIVSHDTGFAPNPFWGYCTLATCKPAIRRTAQKGDWIVGLSPKAKGHRVVYSMRVYDILTYREYFSDPRFRGKIPNYNAGEEVHRRGDNIYMPLDNDRFKQLRSMHSKDCRENPRAKKRDLESDFVLIAKLFHYFGSSGPSLPHSLNELKVGRAHKCRFADRTVQQFLAFMRVKSRGISSAPTKWPAGDESWEMGRRKVRLHSKRK
jgi:hypothetical protein